MTRCSICSSFVRFAPCFFVGVDAQCVRFIVLLLAHRTRLRRVADLYAKRTAGGRDAEILVAESADQVKWFLRGLFLGQPQGVGLDLRLDRGADLRRRAKKAVGGDTAVDALVRTLEVVVLDEEVESSKAVGEIGEDRLAKKLLPERLPEAFDLAERFGMLRPALAVGDAATPK